MWETLVRVPRGSNNHRKFSRVLATFLVACFGYIFITTPTAHAANATWDGDNISYQGNTYVPVDSANLPDDLKSTKAYQYVDESKNPKLIYVIYFSQSTENVKSAKEATYIRYTLNPPTSYINPNGKQTIALTPSENAESVASQEASSCKVDNIGWLVCGIGGYMASGIDTVYKVVAGFLTVQPLTLNDGGLYKLWDVMRNFANVLFIIGFLVIIYSYLAGGGFSGYEIRKILPRVVLAAILVNLSYIICAVAIDASNIAGVSLQDLLINIRESSVAIDENRNVSWDEITTYILSGGTIGTIGFLAATGGSIASFGFLLLGVLIVVVFSLFVAFIILAARQAIIIVLVMLAPIAFAAFILPNTEKWFERWRSVFTTMLLLFPIFSLLFGGSQLASAAIVQNADNLGIMLFGMAIQIVPLVITPLLIQFSGGLIGRVAGVVNNTQKGMIDRSRGWTNKQADYYKDRALGRETRPYNFMRKGGQAMYRRGKNQEDRQKAWQQDAENLRQSHRSYQRVDDHTRDSEARHKQIHAHHDAHYQQRVYNDPLLRAQQTDTRNYEARSKIYANAMEMQDERTFQTALNTDTGYANLRTMQVQATVDSGVADVQKSAIDAAGKLALSTTVQGDRDLRLLKVDTYATEKQSETIDNTLKKNAEANWDYISRTNENMQALRLREVQATDQAKRVEEEWSSLVENVVAKGSAAPNVAAVSASVANSIKDLRQNIQIEGFVQDSAKIEAQAAMSNRLKEDAVLRTYAGGVGGDEAANRIYARAKSELVQGYLDNVKASRSVLSEYSINELIELHQGHQTRGGEPATNAMIDAAMQEIMLSKGNNWAFQKTKDYIASRGMHYDEVSNKYYEDAAKTMEITDTDEIDRRRDEQQMFVDAAKNSKLTIKSMSGTDRGDLETGTFTMSSERAITRDIRDQKINANRLAETDIDELMRMVQVLRDDGTRRNFSADQRQALINEINYATDPANPQISSRIAKREKDMLGVISTYLQNPNGLSDAEKWNIESATQTSVPTNFVPGVPYKRSAAATGNPNDEPYGPDARTARR